MGPEYFWGGGTWIFPLIMLTVMLVCMFLMFGRRGFGPPWMNRRGHDQGEKQESESALDILKKRYAKGEITKEEYEEIKKDL
jgi:putative membrane protein